MTAFSDLIEKCVRRLTPMGVTQTVQLLTASTAGATTLALSDPSGVILPSIQPGVIISIDLEVLFVTAVNGTNISVIPGYWGSTEAAHSAAALVYVNPRFTLYDIGTAINDDLLDLCSPQNGLFQAKSLEITYNPSISGYDLTDGSSGVPVSSILEILSVRYKVPYPIGRWVPVPFGMWELTPSSDTTAFPSGYALTMHADCYPGLPIRITYAAPFSPLVNLTDDVGSVAGLSPTMMDLPPLGAMVALVSPREVRRNQIDSEPDSRRAPEVPPGAVMNSVAGILRLRQSRINAEAGRLSALYGWQQGVQ